jgi:hypothetical protein
MAEKSAVGADLYIEDSPANIASLRDAGCEVICFGNSTNVDVADPRVSSWGEAEQLVQQRLARWRRGPGPRTVRAVARQNVASHNARKAKRKAS